jgi:hypothetical protein
MKGCPHHHSVTPSSNQLPTSGQWNRQQQLLTKSGRVFPCCGEGQRKERSACMGTCSVKDNTQTADRSTKNSTNPCAASPPPSAPSHHHQPLQGGGEAVSVQCCSDGSEKRLRNNHPPTPMWKSTVSILQTPPHAEHWLLAYPPTPASLSLHAGTRAAAEAALCIKCYLCAIAGAAAAPCVPAAAAAAAMLLV